MLSTDLSTISLVLAGLALVVSLACAVVVGRGVEYSRAAWRFVQNENAESLQLRQLAELQTGLTELHDAYQALYDSHKKLRSRIGMRELREKRRSNGTDADAPGDLPDPQKDPDGWKKAMRAKLHLGQIK